MDVLGQVLQIVLIVVFALLVLGGPYLLVWAAIRHREALAPILGGLVIAGIGAAVVVGGIDLFNEGGLGQYGPLPIPDYVTGPVAVVMGAGLAVSGIYMAVASVFVVLGRAGAWAQRSVGRLIHRSH